MGTPLPLSKVVDDFLKLGLFWEYIESVDVYTGRREKDGNGEFRLRVINWELGSKFIILILIMANMP